MAASFITVKLEGIDDLKRALGEVSVTVRKKAVRSSLREAAKVVQVAAQNAAPVLQTATRFRKPGTVKNAITVRASKQARRDGNEGVFISVRPLRGARQQKLGKAGARNPNDPYYWWWVEFGHKIVPRAATKAPQQGRRRAGSAASLSVRRRNAQGEVAPHPFMRPAASKLSEALNVFMANVIPQIEKLNQRVSSNVR